MSKRSIAVDLSVIVKAKADTPCSTFEEFAAIVFLYIMSIAKNCDTCDVMVDRYFEGSLKERVRKYRG